jgi:hypothetical protein
MERTGLSTLRGVFAPIAALLCGCSLTLEPVYITTADPDGSVGTDDARAVVDDAADGVSADDAPLARDVVATVDVPRADGRPAVDACVATGRELCNGRDDDCNAIIDDNTCAVGTCTAVSVGFACCEARTECQSLSCGGTCVTFTGTGRMACCHPATTM